MPVVLALLAFLVLASTPQALAEPLKVAGMPVSFVQWNPGPPSLRYDDVRLSKARLRDLGGNHVATLSRLYKIDLHMNAEGQVDRRITRVVMPLNHGAVSQFTGMRFYVEAAAEVATIEEAYTLLPDGRRLDADPALVQISSDNERHVFDDGFEVLVPMAGVSPLSAAVLVTHVREKAGIRPYPWAAIYYTSSFNPRERLEIRLSWDEGAPAPAWRHDFKPLDCNEVGQREIVCIAERLPAQRFDPDVVLDDVLPTFVIAEATTWADVARTGSELVDQASLDPAAAKALLGRILAGASTDAERLERIYQFVAREIRYLGLEHGSGGYVPRPAGVTLERGFGDCKDKATLFVHLARAAGLHAHAVLVSSERTDLTKLRIPSAAYFDHMVACARTRGGQEYCVDPTYDTVPFGAMVPALNGTIRLDLDGQASGPAKFAPAETLWTVDVRTDNEITLGGAFIERQKRSFDGYYGGVLRDRHATNDRERQREWAKEAYHSGMGQPEKLEIDFEKLDDATQPLEIVSTATYEGFFEAEKRFSYSEPEPWLKEELEDFYTDNKTHPYLFPGIRFTGKTIYRAPAGYEVEFAGAKLNYQGPFGILTRTPGVENGRLTVDTLVKLPRRLIAVEDLKKFKSYLDLLIAQDEISFSLRRIP